MSKQHIYLIPGFFGFTTLGSLNYFQGVRQELERHLADLGVDAAIHETETLPTGSIRQRALRLLRLVEESGGLEGGGVHFRCGERSARWWREITSTWWASTTASGTAGPRPPGSSPGPGSATPR